MIKGCSKSGEKDCFCCSFCFIHSKFVLLMKKRISAYPRKIGSFLGRSFVLEIPALFILNALFPLYGMAYAQFAAELILAAAAMVVLVRLFRRLEAEKEAV